MVKEGRQRDDRKRQPDKARLFGIDHACAFIETAAQFIEAVPALNEVHKIDIAKDKTKPETKNACRQPDHTPAPPANLKTLTACACGSKPVREPEPYRGGGGRT